MASDSDNDKLKNWFLRRFLPAERAVEERCREWDRLWDVYQANPVSTQDVEGDLRSSLRVKHTHQIIHTIMPRMTVPDPEFDLQPQQQVDDGRVDTLTSMMRYDLDVDNFAEKQNHWNESSLVYGTGFAKVVWNYEKYKKKVFKRLGPIERLKGLEPWEEVEITKSDHPSVIPVPIKDGFPDPAATTIEDCGFFVHRQWMAEEKIKRLVKMGVFDNMDLLEKRLADGKGDDTPRDGETKEEGIARREEDNAIEVLEMWTRDRRVIVLVGRSVVMRHDENPYWHGEIPFIKFTPWPKMFSLYGTGIPEVTEDIQDQIHTMENQRIDATSIRLDPPFLVKRNMRGGADFQFGAGARIFVDNFDAIRQLDMGVDLSPGWNEVQAYLGYMQQVTGVNPFIAGIDGSQQNVDQSTATGINILVEGAEKRIGQMVFNQNLGIARMGKLMISLYQQYASEERVRTLVDDTGVTEFLAISPEDIAGEFDVRVRGSGESINREIRRASNIELINALSPLHGTPLADGTVVDIKPALQGLIESFSLPNPEGFFPEAPEEPAGPELGGGLGI